MTAGSRILVVDDNEDFREMLTLALQGIGYHVSQAGDGEAALEVLATTTLDMAIVDLDMPKLNGLALSKKVKETMPEFPIVMVTGYAKFYTAAEILSVGVDVFLQKPVPMEKLLDVIQKL